MKRTFLLLGLLAASVLPTTHAQAAADPDPIYQTTTGTKVPWESYLADTAAGSVSAASLLGISGEAVAPVENVRDLVASLKGLSSDGDKATIAVSITPGRTKWGVDYTNYVASSWWRLLANTTLGYAQGDADISEVGFERRAVSVETSLIFDKDKDPVILLGRLMAKPPKGSKCDIETDPKLVAARAKAAAAAKAAGGGAPAADPRNTPAEDLSGEMKEDEVAKIESEMLTECFDAAIAKLPWNRSQFSLMYGTGWIKPKNGSVSQESLGHTGVLSLTYGFEGLRPLDKALAVSVIYRYTDSEPILDTLGTATVRDKSSSLVVGRLAGGTEKIRGLVEVSDARDKEITASQRAFKQALGLDVRIYEATWINLRMGRQRTINGADSEVGSLLSISYSPSALLR